jgi:hypothetical protein
VRFSLTISHTYLITDGSPIRTGTGTGTGAALSLRLPRAGAKVLCPGVARTGRSATLAFGGLGSAVAQTERLVTQQPARCEP